MFPFSTCNEFQSRTSKIMYECMGHFSFFFFFFNSASKLGKNIYKNCPLKQQNIHPITIFLG